MSEIPGLDIEGLEVSVHGRRLFIKGTRTAPDLEEGESFTWQERGHGEFERTVTLPYEVEADKIEARYDNGLLVVTMPRVEHEKPRKIEVKTA
jgi:HSP20 family protein